jgi:hypothetical protein
MRSCSNVTFIQPNSHSTPWHIRNDIIHVYYAGSVDDDIYVPTFKQILHEPYWYMYSEKKISRAKYKADWNNNNNNNKQQQTTICLRSKQKQPPFCSMSQSTDDVTPDTTRLGWNQHVTDAGVGIWSAISNIGKWRLRLITDRASTILGIHVHVLSYFWQFSIQSRNMLFILLRYRNAKIIHIIQQGKQNAMHMNFTIHPILLYFSVYTKVGTRNY